jgi:hypothetical protein
MRPASGSALRDGDTTVLAEYDPHARITGGEPEQMTEFADRLADRHGQMIPAEDPNYEPLAPAFPLLTHPAGTRSSSRQSPRSSHRNGSGNSSPTTTTASKPPTEPTLIRMLQIDAG